MSQQGSFYDIEFNYNIHLVNSYVLNQGSLLPTEIISLICLYTLAESITFLDEKFLLLQGYDETAFGITWDGNIIILTKTKPITKNNIWPWNEKHIYKSNINSHTIENVYTCWYNDNIFVQNNENDFFWWNQNTFKEYDYIHFKHSLKYFGCASNHIIFVYNENNKMVYYSRLQSPKTKAIILGHEILNLLCMKNGIFLVDCLNVAWIINIHDNHLPRPYVIDSNIHDEGIGVNLEYLLYTNMPLKKLYLAYEHYPQMCMMSEMENPILNIKSGYTHFVLKTRESYWIIGRYRNEIYMTPKKYCSTSNDIIDFIPINNKNIIIEYSHVNNIVTYYK